MGMVKFMRTGVRSCPASSKSLPCRAGMISNLRQPGDIYFYSDITINSAIMGSRYRIMDAVDNSIIIASGIINSDPHVLVDVAAVSSPQLLLLRLRKASSAPYYKNYESINIQEKIGAAFYCAQELD